MIHIGKNIERVIHEQGRSVSWFADRLGCSRVTVYSIFRHASIDTALLHKISLLLGHNFFEDCSEDFNKSERKDLPSVKGVRDHKAE